jgi:hypothetical protein
VQVPCSIDNTHDSACSYAGTKCGGNDAAGECHKGLQEQPNLQCEDEAAEKGLSGVTEATAAAAASDVSSAQPGAGAAVTLNAAPNVAAGKNRQRALDRLQQAVAPSSSSSSVSASQPSTPKVMLNRKAAVAAPWLP